MKEELVSANPFARELVSLRKQVEERIANMEEDLDGFFTEAEASALSDRLRDLTTRLEELERKNEKLEGEVSAMAKALEDLNSATSVVNRGTWYRMASGRLLAGLKSLAGA